MPDQRPPICPACGVTMVPAELSSHPRRDGDWVCLECEEMNAYPGAQRSISDKRPKLVYVGRLSFSVCGFLQKIGTRQPDFGIKVWFDHARIKEIRAVARYDLHEVDELLKAAVYPR